MIIDAKRIGAATRVDGHLADELGPVVIERLTDKLRRWERLGFALSDIEVRREDDPATMTVRFTVWAMAWLDGRPTEVDEQVRHDTTGPLRGTAWAMTYSGEVITVPPPYGLPTGPPGETWVRR